MTRDSIDLREKRADVLARAKELVAKAEKAGRNLSASEEREWSDLLRQADELKARIDRAEIGGGFDAEMRENPQRGPFPLPEPYRSHALAETGGVAGEWRDAETGREVRVLGPEQKFASGRRIEGVTLGGFLRGYITGKADEPTRRALLENQLSTGGAMVPTPLAGELIDLFRAESVVLRAGARTVDVPSSSLSIARLSGDAAASFRGEGELIAESTMTFDRVVLEPKSVACLITMSRELARDGINVEAQVSAAISRAMAAEIDRAFLQGTGVDGEPLGLFNDGSITNAVTSIGALEPGDFVSAYEKILVANAPAPTAAILHPSNYADFINYRIDSGGGAGTGVYLGLPSQLSNMRFFPSTNATTALGIVGGFGEVIVGFAEDINVRLLTERWADYGRLGLICHARVDIAVARPGALCQLQGMTT